MPLIGVIAGMRSELAALGTLAGDPRLAVAVSGARPDRAEAAAERLAVVGCRLLVSWGVAGGLDPALAPGALLRAGACRTPGGETLALRRPGLGGRTQLLLGTDAMILDPGEKARLHRETGAAAVDMETHRIAGAARRLGIEAAAIRAVGDPAGRVLPGLVRNVLSEDGRPRAGAVLLGLLRRPAALPALLRLKRDTDAALRTLAREGPVLLSTLLAEVEAG